MSEAQKLRSLLVRMASEVRGMVRTELGSTGFEELCREILSAFVFGMATAAGRECGLMPEELRGPTAICLHEVFQYWPEEAEQFVRELEHAASATETSVMSRVIQRGVEDYSLWRNRDAKTLRRNVTELLDCAGRMATAKTRPLHHGGTESRRRQK